MGGKNDSNEHLAIRARSDRRVTISALAESLGITKGTVSRALNDYSDISPSTKTRVAARARQMGYTPLTHAQAIKTGRARSLALVLQLEQHDAQSPFLAEFLGGLTQAASREGWTLTLATALSEESGLDVTRRLIAERKADGFILPRTLYRDPRVALLREEGVPFVLYGRTGDAEGCAWFDIRGEDAMADGVARLAALGHRRIGFVSADATFNYAHLRLVGYRAGLAAAGLPFEEALVTSPMTGPNAGTAATEALLDMAAPPTALLCATDRLALGAFRAVRARGLMPGRDLSIIGYDGVPEGTYLDPPLGTYVVDQADAGSRLAQLLIARIRGAEPESLRETATARFRTGGTVAPPP